MQTYQEAENWLFSQLPNYQKQGKSAYKPGLQNIFELANSLHNPQNNFKSIHIAGTNGKGSCSHILASIFQEAGYKVGLFTSPHLKNFTERIKINGKECSNEFVFEFVKKIKNTATNIQPSFFEITTLMAFDYFSKEKVNIAIIETGLGGRLDSTNIIQPILSVITSISYDHQDILGNSLEEICLEKCGIIKQNIPVIDGELKPKLKQIISKNSNEKNTKYIDATLSNTIYESDLKGQYQEQNKKTVWACIKELQSQNWKISNENILNGFKNTIKNTGLRGRWEIFNQTPLVILDVAHNEAGITSAITQIQSYTYKKLHIIIGFVQGKEVEIIITLLPKNAYYYFVKPSIARALNPEEYRDILAKNKLNFVLFQNVMDGYHNAIQMAENEDIILVLGSNFVIADII